MAQEYFGECIWPVPGDAPPMPESHRTLGKPSAKWLYLDGSGSLLFVVMRFDPAGERKQFIPLSLWRDASGLRWRLKSISGPRALYGLDRLAARSDASVVICEGEKSADAAANVFPRSVAMTSPGGSQAASKADWAPLAGRKVLIWPDADEPGRKYADEVASILHGLGCEVSIIDAAALASMALDGSKRESVKGWDAADAVAEWRDLAALRKTAIGLAKPFEAVAHDNTKAGRETRDMNCEITRLAGLRTVEYERQRKDAAEKLGVRAAILDKLVAAARPKEDKQGQGRRRL